MSTSYASTHAVLNFTAHDPEKMPWHGYWTVETMRLLGVVHNPEGVIYVAQEGAHSQVPPLKSGFGSPNIGPTDTAPPVTKNLPSRPLEEFERESLAALRKGSQIMAARDGDKLRVLGAVRAMAADCRACHNVDADHLLGAFTYELKRVGKDEVPPKPVE